MITLSTVGPWQIILILIVLLILVFPIIALINILQNEFTGSNKLIWIPVVLLLPLSGSILYFIIGKSQKLEKK